MKKQILFVLCILLALVFAGCANPINRHTAGRYFDEAHEAEARGDYETARMYASRAYGNAKMGNLGPSAEAYSLYALARYAGYTASYDEAEWYFRDVLELIDQADGSADDLLAPTLAELARLLHDTDQHAKAVPEFQKAVVELEELEIMHEDPIGFADFLTDFAQSARAANQEQLATQMEEGANSLRERNRDMRAQAQIKRYR